ncbi:non-structural polyprotein [Bat badicivirus 1]|uniref:non-structural polyprotein n=1 Tax=Bat badicivirus 1 TaxID=1958785 RepID=UPI0009839B1D|nr:non-structural polyprotein [Bat badicivirus 1]AQP31145.1 non-structural polyprotein [Bat badicivirus 1]
MTVQSKEKNTSVQNEKPHIISSHQCRKASYSSAYQATNAEQSFSPMWWALHGVRGVSGLVSETCATLLNYTYGEDHPESKKLEMAVSRISLMSIQLAQNVSFSSIVVFLLQLTTEFGFTPFDMIRKLIGLYSDARLCSTQLIQSMGDAVKALLVKMKVLGGDDEVVPDPIQQIGVNAEQSMDLVDPSHAAAVAGILGGVAVILGAMFAGVQDYSANKGFLKSIAEFGSKTSKMKNGLYALLACVRDFSSFVKECVLNYFGTSPADSVVKAVDSLKFTFNDEPVNAAQLFKVFAELNTPEGEEVMSCDLEKLNKGTAICGVLSRVLSGQIASAFNIPTGTVSLLSQSLRTFEGRVRNAGNKQNVGNIRFVPYVIWLGGVPGGGKSVTMTHLSPDLMSALQHEDAERYQIPSQDNWTFTANFTQEYHTGYNGQYQMRIDDVCQDKAGTLKQSSAMQFIQWVSSVPANMTQAALEDKKCPFRSKMVLCTSNELWPNRTHEIMSNEAFLRRRNVLIKAVPSAKIDPGLNWGLEFYKMNPLNSSDPGVKFESYYHMVKFILEDYKRHFAAQTTLIDKVNNGNSEGFLAFLAEQSCQRVEEPEEPPARPLTPDVFDDMPTRQWGVPGFEFDHPFVRGENWVAQNWALEMDQTAFNRMMTVLFYCRFPIYHFSATGRLTTPDLADHVVYEYDKVMIASMRNYEWDTEYVQEAIAVARRIYGRVNAEQSAGFEDGIFSVKDTISNLIDAIVESTKRIDVFWEKISSGWCWKILAGVSAMALVYFSVKRFGPSGGSWREMNADASYSHDVGRTKPRATMHTPSYNHEVGRSRPRAVQAVRSNFLDSIFHKNVVKISWEGGPLDTFALNGIFIKDKVLLTCRHFFVGMDTDATLVVTRYPKYSSPVSCKVAFKPENLVRVPGAEDAVLYNVESGVDNFRDISKKFFSGSLPEVMTAATASHYPSTETFIGQVTAFTENEPVLYKMGTGAEMAEVIKGFIFQGLCLKGQSGSPLIADERVSRAPTLFGIQVAISTQHDSSYFEALCQAQIDDALSKFECEQSMILQQEPHRYEQEDEEAWFDAPEYVQEMCNSSLELVGRAKKVVPQPGKTRLLRSPLNELFEKLPGEKQYLPSALRDRDVDILAKSMSGFSREYGKICPRTLKRTLEQFIDEDQVIRAGGQRRLLDDDELLNGIHGQGLKGVELKTSPGIPLVFERAGHPGKTKWITMGDDNQRTMSPDAWDEFRKQEDMLRSGRRVPVTAYACLKDELRTEEKVAAKKTRTFIILPMMFNLLIRKYFGTWISKQHSLAGRISSCVGIDVNRDWTDLSRKLKAKGKDIEDFDYSDWDRSLHPEWFSVYADRVSAWYGDKPGSAGFVVRRALMDQLVYMNVQVGPWLMRTHGGNKSGCAITAEINTDLHDMLVYYVWSRICDERGTPTIQSLPHFRERVSLALYGDDMLKATRADVTAWFNGDAMKKVISELGMHITPGDKDESAGFRIKTLEEVTFLKRRFISFDEDCGKVRAPLDKSVIQRIVLWIHASDSAVDATSENVRGALREAFFWGEDFFRDFRSRCLQSWHRSRCSVRPFPTVGYQDVFDAWRAGHGDLLPARYQFSEVPLVEQRGGTVDV